MPNQQAWTPDTHPETLHTAWDSADPDKHTCVAVHGHKDDVGRHFKAVPAEKLVKLGGIIVPGTIDYRVPADHLVTLDAAHCQRVHDAILAENRLKNMALASVEEQLPDTFKAQATDGDGDLLFILNGTETATRMPDGSYMLSRDGSIVTNPANPTPLMRVKTKHRPTWAFDHLTGKVSIAIPGASAALHQSINAKTRQTHGPNVTVAAR